MERLVPFGKYYLLERVNVGGMAEVFKAKTVGVEGFEKLVAIKRILPSVAEDEEFIKMFIDEAKITSQLSHANLAQTFDLGKINDAYYIAMEYVPGKDLRAVQERLKRRGERVPINIATYVIGRVCEGLDYAHRKRDIAGRELHIVHRDVSPQNVIVSFEGEVKLIDFGIAKAANKITSTQAGILKGKFGYMSPEQVRGLPLDQRSDIFAVGVVLYELCTGERLFTGSSDYSVLEKVQQAKIAPPSEVVRDIPDRLERVILKALAREPEQRYQHAADLAQDLMRFLIESHTRIVSRDDVAAFMKAVFPDDDAREKRTDPAVVERTRTGARRPEPPEPVRSDQPQQRQHHHEPRLREAARGGEPAVRESDKRDVEGRENAARERDALAREQQSREQEQRAQEAHAREPVAKGKEARREPARVKGPTPAALHSMPPGARAQRSAPPKLPSSLIAGIDLAAESGNELTPRGPTRPPNERSFLPTDPGGQGAEGQADSPAAQPGAQAARQPGQPAPPKGPPALLRPPPLAQQSARPPPIPPAPAPAPAPAKSAAIAKSPAQPESPVLGPSAQAKWTARDEEDRTEPSLLRAPAEDEPTRPMSMTELAAAERIFVERERELHAANVSARVEITSPGGPPAMDAHASAESAAPAPGAAKTERSAEAGKAGKPAPSAAGATLANATQPGASARTNATVGAPPAQLFPANSIEVTEPDPPRKPAPAEPRPEQASPKPAPMPAPAEPRQERSAAKPAPIAAEPAPEPASAKPAPIPTLAAPAEPRPDRAAAKPAPTAAARAEPARPPRAASRPPAPLPASLLADVKPPAATQITDPGGPPALRAFHDESADDNTPSSRLRRGEPLQAAAPRNLPPISLRSERPPFGGRMQVNKPTLLSSDPSAAEDSTISTYTRRARLLRWAQFAAIGAALSVAAWAWLSVPHRKPEPPSAPTASLSVSTKPEDALVLLDGATVKGSLDRDYTEPKLSAGEQHVLIVRREGFVEQTQPLTLSPNEHKVLAVQLVPLPGQLTVRSTPSGAQVFLDGEAVGQTPAYLPNVVQEKSHAISLEKHCYRPWQVAIPAHAGKREVAATLEPIINACPNMKVEKEEKMPDLPVDDPKAMASLGFLSLGSRPSASVFIDGVDIGRTTPIVQWPLKVGKHKLRLVLGRNKRDLTVDVRSGQTASEIVDLRGH